MMPFGKSRRRAVSVAGVVVSSLLLLAAGEIFLRSFPPPDFRPYLAERSGLAGPFRPADRFGVQYRSWQAFEDDHRERLLQLRPCLSSARCWAMFGNSFVHMHGMLADTTRSALPDRPVFNLGRNELLCVRAAQVELLLDHGMKPERVIFVLLPHDAVPFAQHSLAQIRVTSQGGIAYEPRRPGGWRGAILDRSRLALLGWVRTGRQKALPDFRPGSLNDALHPALEEDLRRLLTSLGQVSRRHDVPVTVVLIPNHEQIARGAGFGFQDGLLPICRQAGLDVCDVRSAFLSADDKPGLFIPDKHFSQRGNRLLLDAILAHLSRGTEAPARVTRGGTRP